MLGSIFCERSTSFVRHFGTKRITENHQTHILTSEVKTNVRMNDDTYQV